MRLISNAIKKFNWYIFIPILILFLFSSYYILSTSNYVRYWADDFCSSVLLRNNGYWQSQIIWWKSWTGRYSYIAFLDFVELFGVIGAKILPVFLFVVFVFALYLTFGLQISLVLSILFLINSPNIIQSFYWMTGSLNYFAPFIFLNLFLALLFRKSKKYTYAVASILIFIAVGFSESFGVALLFFLIYLLLVLDKSNNRRLLIVGILSTVLSLGLMFLAPGNAVRSSTVSHPEGLLDLLSKTFSYSKWYLIHLLYIKEFVLSVLAIVVGAFVALDRNKKYFESPKKVVLYSIAFMIGITFVVVGLTYQAMNWEPPMRVMTIVNYMIIYSLVIASVASVQLYAKYVKDIVSKTIFILLIVLLVFQVNRQWGSVRDELKTYSTGWDKIETSLIDAPDGSVVEVPELKPVGKLDGFKENKGWVSSCIAGYYNLNQLEYK
jgi:hypothetical protein